MNFLIELKNKRAQIINAPNVAIKAALEDAKTQESKHKKTQTTNIIILILHRFFLVNK